MYLRKRGKKWYYTIEVPTEDGQGRLREERVGGTSYAQAAKAYRQAMKALDEAAVSEKPVIKMMDFYGMAGKRCAYQFRAQYVRFLCGNH
mgnify:CR=1 FL=1